MKRHCSLRKLKVVAFCDIRYFTVDLIMNLVHYIVMDCFFLYFSKNIVSSKKTMYEKSDDDDNDDDDDDGSYLPI